MPPGERRLPKQNAVSRRKTGRQSFLDAVSGNEWDGIRTATQQGQVIRSESFQEEVGGKVGRRLIGETRGRPKGVVRSEIVLCPCSLAISHTFLET